MSLLEQLRTEPLPVELHTPIIQRESSSPPELLPAEIAASELLIQLGREYFTIESPALDPDSKHVGSEARQHVNPRAIANSSPPFSEARDFWEDVAAMSDRAVIWPPHLGTAGLGHSKDPVAYAIATVSASYTLAGSDRRLHHAVSALPLQASSKEPPKASSDALKTATTPDFADALASLFGFEDVAALEDVRELDPYVFTRARELAARAIVAAAVNHSSALKSAEGRRG
jgi:hypothetical protein